MLGLFALLAFLAPLVSGKSSLLLTKNIQQRSPRDVKACNHLLTTTIANLATIYFPVFTPNEHTPWVLGQKNILSWETGGETGIDVFDIQLHNVNQTVMEGFIPIALRVPMTRGAKRGNYGGSMEVDLAEGVPTG